MNVMKIIAENIANTLERTKLSMRHNTCRSCCAKRIHRFGVILCAVGKGLGLVCLGGLLCWNRKTGTKVEILGKQLCDGHRENTP